MLKNKTEDLNKLPGDYEASDNINYPPNAWPVTEINVAMVAANVNYSRLPAAQATTDSVGFFV